MFDHFLVQDDGQETHAYACYTNGDKVEIPLETMDAWYQENVLKLQHIAQ